MRPLLSTAHLSHFGGGLFSPLRLDHPEGLCVDPLDGAIWCGGEGGQLYRIEPDGSRTQMVAGTGGFILGVTLDTRSRLLYLCDLHHRVVWVMDTAGNVAARWTGTDGAETLQLPNFAVIDAARDCLYVSDTRRAGGPGVWRFRLADGHSELWMAERCRSANGLALAPDGQSLYLVESHLPGISRIPIRLDGTAGPKELFLPLPDDEPDGLAFDAAGDLWIAVYNPTRIYRCRLSDRRLELVVEDSTTDWLHHATNLAFRSRHELFVANLGAWHLTRVDLSPLLS
jgi:gluconolactonase